MRLIAISATWGIFCTALAAFGCDGASVSSEDHAIVNGAVADEDQGVVALVYDEEIRCTGAVVSKRVVVTAGHCVSTIKEVNRLSVFFGQSLELGQSILRGRRQMLNGQSIGVLDMRVHEDFALARLEHDIAVILLDADIAAEQVPLLRVPFDDSFVGRQVRIVGFGTTGPDDELPQRKREGTATITSYRDTTFELAPDPAITCAGDSGGPALISIDGTEYLAGVLSAGNCADLSVETRVDAYTAEFLDPYIDAARPGDAETGDRCFYPENCALGTCLQATDAPGLGFCSIPCGNDDGCQEPLRCTEGFCRHPLPSPGALGSPCANSYECESRDLDGIFLPGECRSRASGGDRLCSIECIADFFPCPTGFDCVDSDRPGDQACFAPEGCGCMSGGRADALLPLWIVLVLRLVGRPRRRRRR